MVRIKNPENYKLSGYEIHPGNKKYNALLENKKTGSVIKVGFGEKAAQHYHDKIGHYSYLDHNDKKRRLLYHARHVADKDHKFSSGYWAARILW